MGSQQQRAERRVGGNCLQSGLAEPGPAHRDGSRVTCHVCRGSPHVTLPLSHCVLTHIARITAAAPHRSAARAARLRQPGPGRRHRHRGVTGGEHPELSGAHQQACEWCLSVAKLTKKNIFDYLVIQQVVSIWTFDCPRPQVVSSPPIHWRQDLVGQGGLIIKYFILLLNVWKGSCGFWVWFRQVDNSSNITHRSGQHWQPSPVQRPINVRVQELVAPSPAVSGVWTGELSLVC